MLILLKIKSNLRFLRAVLVQYLVSAFIATALFGLFFYIIRDFSLKGLQDNGLEVQRTFALSVIFLIGLPVALWRRSRVFSIHSEPLLSFTAQHSHQKNEIKSFRKFLLAQELLVSLLCFLFLVLLLKNFLSMREIVFCVFALSITTLVPQFQSNKQMRKRKNFVFKLNRSQVLALAQWRYQQMLKGHSVFRRTLYGLSFIAFAIMIAPLTDHTFCMLFSFFVGMFLSWNLIKQLADDFGFPWFELNAGVSHTAFVRNYLLLAVYLIRPVGAGFLLGWLGRLLIFHHTLEGLTLLRVIFSLLVPPLLFPAFSLQIGPKKSGLNFLIIFLSSLFLCTGIYVQPLVVLLLPIIMYYAEVLQKDRYYRAGSVDAA